MEDKKIFEQLNADNPFISSSDPLPWDNNSPDLSQLNSEVSAEIEQLILAKRREPSLPITGLIFGEAGLGKTHILSRILRKIRKNAWKIIFVAVRTFTNPKRLHQELLSEIMLSMNNQHSEGRTQFDMLMDEVMNAYRERRIDDTFTSVPDTDLNFYLKHDLKGIDKNFLKCIVRYLGTDDRITKENILEWLREGLDEDDSQALGLPLREASELDDTACEIFAKNIIISLGSLLAYAHIPMVICFDELDNMKHNKELIEVWGDSVAFMMNTISGVLPLCFIKSNVWDEIFRPALNLSIVQRLEAGKIIMQGCTISQAKQLIHDRIAAKFPDTAEEKYHWLLSRMANTLTEGISPREVLRLARQALRNGEAIDSITEAYDEESRKIQSVPSAWPPNSEHLTTALREWLTSHNDVKILGGYGKYIKLVATLGGKTFAFCTIAHKAATTASASANECCKYLDEYPRSSCVYIMDKRAYKPTWQKFIAKLAEFRSKGGRVLELDSDSRIDWYALASLVNQISSGNVNLYSITGSRTAKLQDAGAFIRSIDLVPGLFPKSHATPPKPAHVLLTKPEPPKPEPQESPVVIPDTTELKDAVMSFLKGYPMNILGSEKLLSLLAGKGITISREGLLAFVNLHKDSFRAYPARNGSDVVIGLR